MNGRKQVRSWLFRVPLCGALFFFSTQTLAAAPVNSATTKDSATNRKRARVLFGQAEEAFSNDEFEKALSLFQKAQDASFNEAVNFNIAVCFERLDRVAEALAAYNQVQASLILDASIKERALSAIRRLQPPPPVQQVTEVSPIPVPLLSPPENLPAAVVVALPPKKEQLPMLRTWGWVGAGGAALGLGAATTVWILGRDNQRSFDIAAKNKDPQATNIADRADNYQTALQISWALAITGLATVAIDLLWRD